MHQIFVSSTFRDLRSEREAVTWAILKTRNIPAGMEAFPATDERGWKIIKKTIDDSDIYILILGFRYGSVDQETKISWTQKEYRYAKEQGIPVLAFLRNLEDTPGSEIDEKRSRISDFRAEVEQSFKVAYWRKAEDLVSSVSQAIPLKIQDCIDDGSPRPGWIRGSFAGIKVAEELAMLSDENRGLREQVRVLQVEQSHVIERERTPSMIFSTEGSTSSPEELKYRFSIRNVGSCGFVIKSIEWLWRNADSKVVHVNHSLNAARPQYLATNEKSQTFELNLDRRAFTGLIGPKTPLSSIKDSLTITATATATSKPHEISHTESFALMGERLTPPDAATEDPVTQ